MNQSLRPYGITLAFALVVVFAGLFLAGCESVPTSAPPGLTQAEFFQRAQEAADGNNWRTSLFYYETFIDRYPSDRANIAAARYEIAFIHYKLGNYSQAKSGFDTLLSEYKGPNADQLPEWPKVLAQKILAEVDQHLGITPDAKVSGTGNAAAAPVSAAK
ncbi:MAG TPA: tetratricopeptide repeat protein [Spirochaetia bacterium]|nr:tetratricopeptide repeat protein [Spirochaetia bacterium]